MMKDSLLNVDFEPLTEVKAKLSEKVARLNKENRLLAITLNGKPKALLVPYIEFLNWLEEGGVVHRPRRLTLAQWESEAKQRREVVQSIKRLFDLSLLKRKGGKPYKRNALKKFTRS